MTRFIALLSFVLTIFVLSNAAPVSAASLSDVLSASKELAAQSLVAKAQYGGGYGDPKSLRRDYDDDDAGDDDDGYDRRDDDDGRRGGGYDRRDDRYDGRRYSRFDHDSRFYCRACARRCADGFCPPRCWGWWRHCRRHRY